MGKSGGSGDILTTKSLDNERSPWEFDLTGISPGASYALHNQVPGRVTRQASREQVGEDSRIFEPLVSKLNYFLSNHSTCEVLIHPHSTWFLSVSHKRPFVREKTTDRTMAIHLPQYPSLSSSDEDEDEILTTCGENMSPVISQLPPRVSTHHVLYFRSVNNRVYRSIIISSNYDFYLVHRLIQHSFGWSNIHLHQFEVRHNCEFYKVKTKKTWMKISANRIVYIVAHKNMMLDDQHENQLAH